MTVDAHKKTFLSDYEKFPQPLKLALRNVSKYGPNSHYDHFKRTYEPRLFGLEVHPVTRQYDDVGERVFDYPLLSSYSPSGQLISVKSRIGIDLAQRHRDFFVASVDLETEECIEWDILPSDVDEMFEGSGDALIQTLQLQSMSLYSPWATLKMSSQGAWFNGDSLAPITELENKLSEVHRKFGHQLVQACLLSNNPESATVAA